MRYYVDTEFNEQDGELISFALAAENGKNLYFELPLEDALWKPWVREHVKPLLTGPLIDRETGKSWLLRFLHGDEYPVFVADWPADILHVCALLDLGEGKCIGPIQIDFILRHKMDTNPKTPHHALSDAIALKEAWEKRTT